MSHHIHTESAHIHVHGPGCGHTAVLHGDHVDYLHDGHLHNHHGDQTRASSPAVHFAAGPTAGHVHGPDCGHEAVPHGDHVDYLVGTHLHHPHGGHCDNHGELKLA